MKKLFVILTSCVLSLSCSQAAERGIYWGVAGALDSPMLLDSPHGVNSFEYTTRSPSVGTRYELGVRLKVHELYAAFHQSDAPEIRESHWVQAYTDVMNVTTRTTDIHSRSENHILLGYRYRPKANRKTFAPYVGGGVSMGKVWRRSARDGETRTVTFQDGEWNVEVETWHQDESKATTFAGGFYGEFGSSISLSNHLELMPMLQVSGQLQRYQPDWNGDYHEADNDLTITPSLLLQLRYAVYAKRK